MMRYTLVPRELHRYEILERKSKFPEQIGDSYFVPVFEELWDELENSLELYFCLDPVRRFNEIKETFLPSDEVYEYQQTNRLEKPSMETKFSNEPVLRVPEYLTDSFSEGRDPRTLEIFWLPHFYLDKSIWMLQIQIYMVR